MSANLSNLVPELVEPARALVRAAGNAGLLPRVTSAVRSRAEQTRLYRRSLQGLQPYYVAPPGTSAHEYGWAFDLVVTPFDALSDVGFTWKAWGGAWDASDPVHFELPGASAEAKRLGAVEMPDPLLKLAQANAALPWYVQLLTPWQLSIYNDFPSVRPLMRTLAFGGPDFFLSQVKKIWG